MRDLLIIGGSGFSGKRLCATLNAMGMRFDALVRRATDTGLVGKYAENLVEGDITDVQDLAEVLQGYKRCIHIPDLARVKDAKRYIEVYSESGMEKVVFVSSTNMFTKLPAATRPRRKAAEEAIKASGLNYVIIRPTMIYGGCDDRNVCRLVRLIKKWPMLPVLNKGLALQQPIYVEDHVRALVDALESDNTYRKAYNISGPEPMTYRNMMHQIANVFGKNTKYVSVPVKPIYLMARLMEKCHLPVPFRSEQFLRLVEDKSFDHEDAAKDFEFNPRSFEEGLSAGYFPEEN